MKKFLSAISIVAMLLPMMPNVFAQVSSAGTDASSATFLTAITPGVTYVNKETGVAYAEATESAELLAVSASQADYEFTAITNETEYHYSLLDRREVDGSRQYFIFANDMYTAPYTNYVTADNTFDPSDTDNNIAKFLNNEFYNDTIMLNEETVTIAADGKYNGAYQLLSIDNGIKPYIQNHNWLVEGNTVNTDVMKNDYLATCKIALLSLKEYIMYSNKIGYQAKNQRQMSRSSWYLRSPMPNSNGVLTKNHIGFVSNTTGAVAGDGSIISAGNGGIKFGIRPCFWVSEDYFKNVKIDISTAGVEVIKAIRKLDFANGLYTEDEMTQMHNALIRVNGRSEYLGNIFFDDSRKKISVDFTNMAEDVVALDVRYEIQKARVDAQGTLAVFHADFALDGGATQTEIVDVATKISGYGTYELKVTVTSKQEGIEEITIIPFSICPSVAQNGSNERLGTINHFDYPDRDVKGTLALMKKVGFGNNRGSYKWDRYEAVTDGVPTFYELPYCEEYFEEIGNYGLDNIVCIGMGNPAVMQTIPEEVAAAAANGDDITSNYYLPKTPEGRNAFVNYVLRILERHSHAISVIEVWNEPNEPTCFNVCDIEKDGHMYYYYLLRDVYNAVKPLYPDIKIGGPVISTTMGDADIAWYDAFLAIDGVEEYLDVLCIHNYSFTWGIDTILEKLPTAISKMKELKPEIEVRVTEFGVHRRRYWESGYLYDSGEEVQATRILRYCLLLDANNIADKYYLYQLSENNMAEDAEAFAILDSHEDVVPYAARPAFIAVANFNRLIAGAETRSFEKIDGIYKASFYDDERKQQIYAFFIDDTMESETYEYKLEADGSRMEFLDMYGNSITKIPYSDGYYSIPVSTSPIYAVVHMSDEIKVNAIEKNGKITLSGKVEAGNPNEMMAVRVYDQNGETIYVNQTQLDGNLNFTMTFGVVEGVESYLVKVSSVSVIGSNSEIYTVTFEEEGIRATNISVYSETGEIITLEQFNHAETVTINAFVKEKDCPEGFWIFVAWYNKDNELIKVEMENSANMEKNNSTYGYKVSGRHTDAAVIKVFAMDLKNQIRPIAANFVV